MIHEILFYCIVGLVIFDFAFGKWLDYLNGSMWSASLPKEAEGIYTEEEYAKSQRYDKARGKVDNISGAISIVATLVMLLCGGFAWLDGLVSQWTDSAFLQALAFFGILGLGSSLISLPFSYYSTFVIEEEFGFNRSTPKIFWLDLLKGTLLSSIIGGVLLWAIMSLYAYFQDAFWIYAFVVVASFSIFMSFFYSELIVPLFNKQKPLEEGELKEAISAFAKKADFKLDNIFVLDGSKRSTKANAYFTGFGSKKRIVLYDTLINDLTTEELVAVLAHEIGHYKKRHVITGLILSLLQMAFMFYVFSLCVGDLAFSQALGVNQIKFHVAILVFSILFSPLSSLLGLGMTIMSRKNEYEADDFAKGYLGGDPLINGLKKLSVKNLSNLTPHPLYVFFHYSHPPLLKRIENLKK